MLHLQLLETSGQARTGRRFAIAVCLYRIWAAVSSNELLPGSKDSHGQVQATNREMLAELDGGVDGQAMPDLRMQHYGRWVFPWNMGLDEFAHRYWISNDEGKLHAMALGCESLTFSVHPLAYHFAFDGTSGGGGR